MNGLSNIPSQTGHQARTSFGNLLNTSEGRYPLQQRIEDKKRGIGRQKYPFVAWILTAVMVGVMIYELVYNSRQQGSPFSFKVSVSVHHS